MRAVIAIPVYKPNLSWSEKISLQQVDRIMSSWKKVFVAPETLFIDYEMDYDVIRFPDLSFQSREKYSQLLLSENFYKRFYGYEYILIYQLDAFVFSDKLAEFCNMGYDYIGAPILRTEWTKMKHGRVGNGGFSLRKIQSCIRVTEKKRQIFSESKLQEWFENGAEDAFFAYCGSRKDIDFNIPNIKTALAFSIQSNVSHCYEKLSKEHLPFGCHGWSMKRYFPVWRPYIEMRYGSLRSLEKEINCQDNLTYKEYRIQNLYPYFGRRVTKMTDDRLKKIFVDVLSNKLTYAIWGAGIIGVRVYDLFKRLNLDILSIYDRNWKSISSICDTPVEAPDIEFIIFNKIKLIVATTRYENEISRYLQSEGLESGKDFLLYNDLISLYLCYMLRNLTHVGDKSQ